MESPARLCNSPPKSEREPVVGGVPQQPVAEVHRVVVVPLDEVLQALPGGAVPLGQLVDDLPGQTERGRTDRVPRVCAGGGGRPWTSGRSGPLPPPRPSRGGSIDAPPMAAASSSRRNSGLPSDRCTNWRRSCSVRGASWAASSANAMASDSSSGPSSIRAPSAGPTKPARRRGGSRRTAMTWRPRVAARWPEEVGRRLVHEMGVLDDEQPRTRGGDTASSSMTASGQTGPAELLFELPCLGRLGQRQAHGPADQGRPGRTAGRPSLDRVDRARPAASSDPSAGRSRSPRSSPPDHVVGGRRVVALAHRGQLIRSAVSSRSARASRDLPTPAARRRSRSAPPPSAAAGQRTERAASSGLRPTKGSSSAIPTRCIPVDGSHAEGPDRLGLALDEERLELLSGESGRRPGRAGPVWSGSVPAAALAMRRAARLTASPMTVKVRRYGGPTSPTKTEPRFTPIRIGNGRSASMISRTASSMRCSSSPEVDGRSGGQDDLAAVVVHVRGQKHDFLPVDGALDDA